MRVSLEDYLTSVPLKPEEGLEVVEVYSTDELTSVLLDIEERRTNVDHHASELDHLLNTNANLTNLIGISEISTESYPLLKACLQTYPKASVLPSMESFSKDPVLGSQIAMESILSFIGDVWDSILRAIKRLIVAIYDFFKSIYNWAKNFFGKSTIQLEKDIKAAPDATHTTVDGHVVDIKSLKVKVGPSLAKHLWIRAKGTVSDDIINDVEKLNTLFVSGFLHELNYRKGQDFGLLKTIIDLSKKFVQPDANKFGKNDFLHYCKTVNDLTAAEKEKYMTECVEVYKRNGIAGHYIGNLEVRVEQKEDNDIVVFARKSVETEESYEIPAMDKHDLTRLASILKLIGRSFDSTHDVTDFTQRQKAVLDDLNKLVTQIRFEKKKGMSGKEGTVRLSHVNGALKTLIEDIKYRLTLFHIHSSVLIPHLVKLTHLLDREYIQANLALLNNATKPNS